VPAIIAYGYWYLSSIQRCAWDA